MSSQSSSQKIRVALLFGGRSGEHGISCVTAGGILRAIDRERFDVLPIGITPTGRWVQESSDPDHWLMRDGKLPHVDDADHAVEILPPASMGSREFRALSHSGAGTRADADAAGEGDAFSIKAENLVSAGRVDVVFPVLHGPYGEDGTVQGLLELIDMPYVGAGVLASAAGMDKHYTKVILEQAGIPVAPYVLVTPHVWENDRATLLAQVERLGYPVFVKPSRAGSSLGITKVNSPDGLEQAVLTAQKSDPKVLVEAALHGREIECAVLAGRNGSRPRTAQPGEIVVKAPSGFYDYEAKYFDDAAVDLQCPADLSPEASAKIQDVAKRSFEALGCEGLSRVDVFYDPDFASRPGGHEVSVNEINTMPGFTPISMFPRMWIAAGMTYTSLITELIDLALERGVGLR